VPSSSGASVLSADYEKAPPAHGRAGALTLFFHHGMDMKTGLPKDQCIESVPLIIIPPQLDSKWFTPLVRKLPWTKERSLVSALKELKADIALIEFCNSEVKKSLLVRVGAIRSDGDADIKSVFKEFCADHGMRFSTSKLCSSRRLQLETRQLDAPES
jgi:hypothetical protein